MRNKVVITLALWLLDRINVENIKFQNNWKDYKLKLEGFLLDGDVGFKKKKK